MKTNDQEKMMKEKMQELNQSLNDTNASSQTVQERLQQVNVSLSNSENENRVLVEKLDTAKLQQQESKRTIDTQNEKIQALRNSIADAEVRFLQIQQRDILLRDLLCCRNEMFKLGLTCYIVGYCSPILDSVKFSK